MWRIGFLLVFFTPQTVFLLSLDTITHEELVQITQNFTFQNISNPKVTFFFYQKNLETVNLTVNNSEFLLDKNSKYIFMIHGAHDNGKKAWILNMTKAFHEKGIFNTIGVDWSIEADGDYVSSGESTQSVGYFVADFISSLNITLKKVHLIGHSFGAEVCAFCGQKLKGEVGRITGLDSTVPPFYTPVYYPPNLRLSPNDAKFVDVIHTTFVFNVTIPYGSVEFWVNYKQKQPDCALFDHPNSCAHQMAHVYFTKTILNGGKYPGVKENSWGDLTEKIVFMGYWVDQNAKGFYYVKAKKTGIVPGNYTLNSN